MNFPNETKIMRARTINALNLIKRIPGLKRADYPQMILALHRNSPTEIINQFSGISGRHFTKLKIIQLSTNEKPSITSNKMKLSL